MNNSPTSVLPVDDDPAEVRLVQAALAATGDNPFRLEWVNRLADALERLGRHGFDVVLLGLTLPDGQRLATFHPLVEAAPNALILIPSPASDEESAHLALPGGVDEHVAAHSPPASYDAIERGASQSALCNGETFFRAISDASPLGIFVADAQGRCVYSNAAHHKISGRSLEQTLGTNWSRSIHPEDRQRVVAAWHAAARAQEPFQAEVRCLREDGSVVWARLNAAPLGDLGATQAQVQTVEDISVRKSMESVLQAAEEALFEERERARVTLNSIGDAVLTTDLLGNVSYLNLVAEAMTGWSREEALGRPLSEVFRIIDGTTRQAAANPVQRVIDEDRSLGLIADCLLVRRDGAEYAIEDSAAPIHNRYGRVVGAVIVFHDVSKSRAMTLKMAHLAQHDVLTGLANRSLLTERLAHAIALARRHAKQVALLFLDLDHFKDINDSLGHVAGDQLLQSLASRLAACVRTTDTVCRQGGDEFVILLADIEQPQDAAHVAEKLHAACAAPQLVGGHELHVTLSVGISVYPDDGGDADTMMRNADTAMYHAKASGRNSYQFFTADMNTRAVRRLLVESSLRRALKQDEFVLHYQPQIDLAAGTMTGAEALVRWRDPDRGLVYPGDFLAIAEECGLIVPIGRWVLREACRQVQAWLDAGLQVVPVAVNISAVEFRRRDFLEGVALSLKETGLAARYLELELTESTLMHDAESSASVLDALKTMGIRLAIDDFGTGYSSLGYLKRFPIGTLKIDQSFVRDIATGADDATIVSTVIGMARNLRQRVIAEGVETREQLAFLQTQRCDEGQGFQFSHPLSAEDFARLLRGGNDLPPWCRPAGWKRGCVFHSKPGWDSTRTRTAIPP
ncbi:MAG: EAL domain-containing protein [Candidatus Accumulibacter sp.]|uniref:EAL domain-containing protein n=1 Tax=Accumulibacter sp. TaxID=2053492 RepID=UPI0019DC4BB6|nr:EAL domain-containing protein [Accumulibacter sp.]MBE2260183.1 EAL domain-containing protein [Paracoccaceae bacterium]MCP5248334.1 EAL domain-containing protein [Accumulibacter sp.]